MPAKKKPTECERLRLEVEDLKATLAIIFERLVAIEEKLAAQPAETQERRAKWFGW